MGLCLQMVAGKLLTGPLLADLITKMVTALDSRDIPTVGSIMEFFNKEVRLRSALLAVIVAPVVAPPGPPSKPPEPRPSLASHFYFIYAGPAQLCGHGQGTSQIRGDSWIAHCVVAHVQKPIPERGSQPVRSTSIFGLQDKSAILTHLEESGDGRGGQAFLERLLAHQRVSVSAVS